MQGSPGSLGLTAPEMCFLPKTPHRLITCAACLCSPHIASAVIMPQTPCSSQTCLHKALLGPPNMHPAGGRRLVTKEQAGQDRQTSGDQQEGCTYHSLYRLLLAHRMPKSKEKQWVNGAAGVQSHSQRLHPIPQ